MNAITNSNAHSPIVTISPDPGILSQKRSNNLIVNSEQLTAPGDSHSRTIIRGKPDQFTEFASPQNSYLHGKKSSLPPPIRNRQANIFDNSINTNHGNNLNYQSPNHFNNRRARSIVRSGMDNYLQKP